MKLNYVCLVVGHDSKDKGAFSATLGKSEYDYSLEVAELVGCDVMTHSANGSYKAKMSETYSKLSRYKLTLELHFNAANGVAQGVEALYFNGSDLGKEYATKYAAIFARAYGLRNRGAKPLSLGSRGYWAVASGRPTGLILEPFFGDEKQCERYDDVVMHAEVLRNFVLSL